MKKQPRTALFDKYNFTLNFSKIKFFNMRLIIKSDKIRWLKNVATIQKDNFQNYQLCLAIV